jgi:hypothetical protein
MRLICALSARDRGKTRLLDSHTIEANPTITLRLHLPDNLLSHAPEVRFFTKNDNPQSVEIPVIRANRLTQAWASLHLPGSYCLHLLTSWHSI